MKNDVCPIEQNDGEFSVRCELSEKSHKIHVESVFIKGMPILKIKKLRAPLCKHHFIFRCPGFIANQK